MTPAERELKPCQACEDAAKVCESRLYEADEAFLDKRGDEERVPYEVSQSAIRGCAQSIRSSCRHTALTPARDEGVTVPKNVAQYFARERLSCEPYMSDLVSRSQASELRLQAEALELRDEMITAMRQAMLAAPQPEGRE